MYQLFLSHFLIRQHRQFQQHYDNQDHIYGELTEFAPDEPIQINFVENDTLFPGIENNVLFLVDVASNASITDFQVTIDSTGYLSMFDTGSNSPPRYRINGEIMDDVLSVASTFAVVVPKDFDKAFVNYPNPFGSIDRPTTTIRYYLEQDADIELKIYTLLGELVWSASYLKSEPRGKKGLHDGPTAFIWNARNMNSETVLNGIYIARLSTSYGRAAITKIAIVK